MSERPTIIVAMNSFKGSLSAIRANELVTSGFSKGFSEAKVLQYPMADGGDGTLEVLVNALGGSVSVVTVTGPYGKRVEAPVGMMHDFYGKKTAIIESAKVSGLALVPPSERDVFQAQCKGVGELMRWAREQGASRIIVGIGGTAMNDGGIGAVIAAGGKVLGADGKPVPSGIQGLFQVRQVDLGEIRDVFRDVEVIGLTDVKNPLVGSNGATFEYGPQKGLGEHDVRRVDLAMKEYSSLVSASLGKDPSHVPMCGAGGGLGAALWAFFDAKLMDGAEFMMKETGLLEAIPDACLVITGEGRVDSQTRQGKVPYAVAQRCQREGVPCIVLGGGLSPDVVDNNPTEYTAAFSCMTGPSSLPEAIRDAERNLFFVSQQIGSLYRSVFLAREEREEITSGGVVLRNLSTEPEVLLVKDRFGRYCLPKGHVDRDESLRDAAIREVLEETGIMAELLGVVGDFTHRFFTPDMKVVRKTVRYFAMRPVSGEPKPQEGETIEARWVPISKLETLSTYGNTGLAVKEALSCLGHETPGNL
jgi:glycerate kinase